MFAGIYAKLGLGLAVAIFVGLAAFAIKSGINKIERQGQQIEGLTRDLAAEKQARESDVRGLTVLSEGIVAASSARSLDEEVLRDTIDSRNPQPVSDGLSRYLDGLRANDRNPGAPAPAQRPGPAAPRRAPAPAGQ
jgi:hypothetical protein